jgi:SAM-dependent methyltransferase
MSQKSSSFNTINSDHQISILAKFLYLVYNFADNIFDSLSKDAFEIRFLAPRSSDELASRIENYGEVSPARFLSDEFWRDLNLENIKNTIGGEISAIEIGCGTGRYGKLLLDKDSSLKYVGVDISEPTLWAPDSHSDSMFLRDSSENIEDYLGVCNFLFTQSALEHFEFDLDFFARIEKRQKTTKLPLIQVHVFPSKACLKTFLWHGIRQYNFRKIRRIIEIAHPETKPILICLGGPSTNKFHWDSITRFSIRKLRQRMYTSYPSFAISMANAIKRDELSRRARSATFYVLLLQSNIGQHIEFKEFVSE